MIKADIIKKIAEKIRKEKKKLQKEKKEFKKKQINFELKKKQINFNVKKRELEQKAKTNALIKELELKYKKNIQSKNYELKLIEMKRKYNKNIQNERNKKTTKLPSKIVVPQTPKSLQTCKAMSKKKGLDGMIEDITMKESIFSQNNINIDNKEKKVLYNDLLSDYNFMLTSVAKNPYGYIYISKNKSRKDFFIRNIYKNEKVIQYCVYNRNISNSVINMKRNMISLVENDFEKYAIVVKK